MTRIKRSVTSRSRHKKIIKQAKSYRGSRNNVFRVAKQAVMKSHQYAYRDRRNKKRLFRSIWISRINAAARQNNMTYSFFINEIKKHKIEINRKILSNFSLEDKEFFKHIIEKIKKN